MPPSGIAAAEPAHGARRRTDVYGDPLPLGAITRMGTFRFWVKTPISSITFSPDGKVAWLQRLTAVRTPFPSGKRTRAGWSSCFRRMRASCREDSTGTGYVAFAPDGKSLAACDFQLIVIWETSSGRMTRVIRGPEGGIFGIRFAPDAKSLAFVGGDETLRIWSLATGEEVRPISAPRSVVPLARVFARRGGLGRRMPRSNDQALACGDGRDDTVPS